MADTNFYPLKIKEVSSDIADAIVLTFDVSAELKEKFQYEHGQYVTLKFKFKDKEERRAYSLCSSPSMDSHLKIAVKRVYKGLVSNHINDNIKAGDMVEVMPPQGHFSTPLESNQSKDYFLVAAGSGVTPMLSILKTVLEEEPKSNIYLLYGNRNEESIMFKAELDALEKRYVGQLKVIHTLSKPKERKEGGIFGLFAKKIIDWQGKKGRVNAALAKEVVKYRKGNRGVECFLCGPVSMMTNVENALKESGIDEKNIHIEWFTPPVSKDAATVGNGKGAKATVILNKKTIELTLLPNETILDGLLRIDEDPPYSCMSGACSTCVCKIQKGNVEMDRCLALSDEEVKNGSLLSCVAVPTTDEIEVNFDV